MLLAANWAFLVLWSCSFRTIAPTPSAPPPEMLRRQPTNDDVPVSLAAGHGLGEEAVLGGNGRIGALHSREMGVRCRVAVDPCSNMEMPHGWRDASIGTCRVAWHEQQRTTALTQLMISSL